MNMYSYTNIKSILWMATMLLTLFVSGEVRGQTPIRLEEAITVARQTNRTILKAQQAIEVKKSVLEQTKGSFLPHVGISMTDVASNNPLHVFGYKLLQEEVSQADFNPDILNAPDVKNQFNLAVSAMMPLYNQEAKAQQEAVGHQIKMSESMSERTVQHIELETIKSYYMLLLTQRAVDVLEQSHAAAKLNYAVVENYFNQGLMLKSDLLEMQVMVNQFELALLSGKMQVENAQSFFNHILGASEETDYQPTDPLTPAAVVSMNEDGLNMERSDFQAIQQGILAMESTVKASKKSFLPKVNAFAGFEFNDDVPFAMGANNFQVGITVGWNIYSGNMRAANIKNTKAEMAETRLDLNEKIASAELEILITRRTINDIKSQIAFHDLSITQATEALDIRKNRFEQGLEKSSDIIQAESQLSQKRLVRLQALYELNMKNAYLNFLLK